MRLLLPTPVPIQPLRRLAPPVMPQTIPPPTHLLAQLLGKQILPRPVAQLLVISANKQLEATLPVMLLQALPALLPILAQTQAQIQDSLLKPAHTLLPDRNRVLAQLLQIQVPILDLLLDLKPALPQIILRVI